MLRFAKNAITQWNYPGRRLIPDRLGWRTQYSRLAQTLHPIEGKRRKRLARQANGSSIAENLGYASIGLGSDNIERLEAIRDFALKIDWNAGVFKKPHLMQRYCDIDQEPDVRALAYSREITDPIASYLGSYPVFQSAAVWYSPNTEFVGRSQRFHLDGEDLRQVKCFLPLDVIAQENGPLTIVPANASLEIYERLLQEGTIRRRNTKLDDAVIERFVPKQNWVEALGQLGDAFFADTCRCYHFGSRGSRPRLLLNLHYLTMNAVQVPLFVRNAQKLENERETLLFGYKDALYPNKARRKDPRLAGRLDKSCA